MNKALEEVMQYANEDVASIHKHWIIFVQMTRRIIVFAIVVGLVYSQGYEIVGNIGDFINTLLPTLPFMVRDNLLFIAVMVIFIYAVVEFIKTLIIYKTIGLTINNIQIKGVSGIASIGQINASLEQISHVEIHKSLLGRLLHYGTITISLNSGAFSLTYMTEVDKFQDSITLLQEAQKEGRYLRSDERQDESLRNQTMAQVQALGIMSNNISEALLSAVPNQAIAMQKHPAIAEAVE